MKQVVRGWTGWLGASAVAVSLLPSCGAHEEGLDPANLSVAGSGGGAVEVRPCASGAERACYVTLGEHDGVLSCFTGTQRCNLGSWGTCENGTVSEIPAPDGAVGQAGSGSTRTQALSSPTGCAGNLCDPFCQVYTEVPTVPLTTDMTESPYT
jgi:hypothetical protein